MESVDTTHTTVTLVPVYAVTIPRLLGGFGFGVGVVLWGGAE